MKSEKFELIKDVCIDMRNIYHDKVNEFVDNSLANGDITEEEAAELKTQF